MLKLFPLILLIIGCEGNTDVPYVKTPSGAVAGLYKRSYGGQKFSAFEGIPYAKPPVGDRRFQEPEPLDSWQGVWNATTPTICAQSVMMRPNETIGDEDCLHLNVYVPNTKLEADANLDVIVDIHGGAYMYGSGLLYTKPELIMDYNVIFITFNYRLGILGFLSTEDEVLPGNNGMKDQVMALQWVQDNIKSFGGNPNSVTLHGLSAGGSSVHLHYFSPMSRKLFHRGISHSGSALHFWSVQQGALQKALKLGHSLGCATDNTKLLVECLKQRPYRKILDKVSLFFSYKLMPAVPFGPIVEKNSPKPFLSKDPYLLLKKGNVYKAPWILSMTTHEGLFPLMVCLDDLDTVDKNWNTLAPTLLDYNYTVPQHLWTDIAQKVREKYLEGKAISMRTVLPSVQIFSDRIFLEPVETTIKLQAKHAPTYFYSFGYLGDNNPLQMVGHGSDVKYVYGSFRADTLLLTPDELKMSQVMLTMITSFAKNGTPIIEGVEWKPADDKEFTYLSIEGPEVGQMVKKSGNDFGNRSFWKSLNFPEGENLLSNKDEL